MKLVKETAKDINQKVTDKEAEEAFIKILNWMGEDPGREGLLETPKRVIKAFKEYLWQLFDSIAVQIYFIYVLKCTIRNYVDCIPDFFFRKSI